jgi:hypothetical protein
VQELPRGALANGATPPPWTSVARSTAESVVEERGKEVLGLEGPNRYFKNKLGGLGQYYFGPLRDLGVLDYTSEGGGTIPGYDKKKGSALADVFATNLPEDDFFRLLDASEIHWSELDALAEFCPCRLRDREAERSLLIDLFFARSDAYHSPESSSRRTTLALILDLVSRSTPVKGRGLEDVFRAATYTRSLHDGTLWEVHSSLVTAQHGWATYEQNELLSLALQALFAGLLGAINRDRSGRLLNAAAAGDVCVALLPSSGGFRERSVADVVSELQSSLPAISAWNNPEHELQRGWKILKLGTDDAALEPLVDQGLRILLSLLARGIDDNPYARFEFEPDYGTALRGDMAHRRGQVSNFRLFSDPSVQPRTAG